MERPHAWLVAAGIFLGANKTQAQEFNPEIEPPNHCAADSSSATKPKPEKKPEPYQPPEKTPYVPPTQEPTKGGADNTSSSRTKAPPKNDNPAK